MNSFRLMLASTLCCSCLPLWAWCSPVTFTVQSVGNGKWSDPSTWSTKRLPRAGDYVQIRPGHRITYDVHSTEALRMLHVSGILTFSREKSTQLVAGLIKVQPGEEATEGAEFCDYCPVDPKMPMPALEIGTIDNPIPASVTAPARRRPASGRRADRRAPRSRRRADSASPRRARPPAAQASGIRGRRRA